MHPDVTLPASNALAIVGIALNALVCLWIRASGARRARARDDAAAPA